MKNFYLLILISFILFSKNILSQGQFISQGSLYGNAGDGFGASVSISDDGFRIVIGGTGYIKAFEWNGNAWNQLGQTIYGTSGDGFGGSVAISGNGLRIAVGIPNDDNFAFSSGAVKIFDWNGSSWIQLGSDIFGESSLDQCGMSVSLSDDGSRVAMGAPYNGCPLQCKGQVRVFEWNGNVWLKLGQDIDGIGLYDLNGSSVSLSDDGSRVAMGAPGNDNANGNGSGQVRVFEFNGSSWTQKGQSINGVGQSGSNGTSVSLNNNGTKIVMGEPNTYNFNGIKTGHVRVFELSGNSWIQQGQTIFTPNIPTGDIVSISDDGLLISTNTIGYAPPSNFKVFQWDGISWNNYGNTINEYGYDMSLSGNGNKIIIGHPGNNSVGTNAGIANIYNYDTSIINTLSLYGITDFSISSGAGRAIHLKAEGYIPDLSIFGIGVANNGGGSDGQEYTFPSISVNPGQHILLARDSAAMHNYLGNGCYSNFDHVIEDNLPYSINGDDAIELFLNGSVIETFGDVNVDGTGQPWEYRDSWAYKLGATAGMPGGTSFSGFDWSIGAPNCTDFSINTLNSNCPYPFCIQCSIISVNDTTNINVSDIQFQNISPKTYFHSVDTFASVTSQYCDSIVTNYNKFIFNANFYTDTINVTTYDTLLTYDTIYVDIFDTTYISISVTDTLYIDITVTGVPNIDNTISVYPNPASDVVIIDNGNYNNMSNYNLMIFNSLSQQVFSSQINTQQFQIPVSTLGAEGTYFVQIFDGNNNLVIIKYLVLN